MRNVVAVGPEAYSAWRATTLGAITEAIEQQVVLHMMGELAGAAVLDVGCGDGALIVAAVSRGAIATGIDPDSAMLAAARTRAAKAAVAATFLDARIERLPFPDASFDVVVAITVLCFIGDAPRAVHEMVRVVRPGGRLVIGELGRLSLWAALRRLRGWLGSNTWAAAHFRTAGELRVLLENAGLSVTAVQGAVYYPPAGPLARALAPVDSWFHHLGTFGAAFIAVAGTRRAKG